jgi:hypothetical protein
MAMPWIMHAQSDALSNVKKLGAGVHGRRFLAKQLSSYTRSARIKLGYNKAKPIGFFQRIDVQPSAPFSGPML